MTSGLFNTGGAGGSAEYTSDTAPSTALPEPSMSSKFVGHDDFLANALNDDFDDMDMFGDLGSGFDQLDDASLDSFTDLTALLSEHNSFLDQLKDEGLETEPFPDASENAEATTTTTTTTPSLKRSFDQMEAGSSDLDVLTARVSVPATPNLDHDYSSKRPRMSASAAATTTEMSSVQEISLTPPPAPSPSPSTSFTFTFAEPMEDSRVRDRREKNNMASKRSREIRKQKFVGMESEADRLIGDNQRLEKRVAELERLAKKMREILVAKMAGK